MSDIFLRALEPEDYLVTHEWRLDEDTWSAVVGIQRFVGLETERRWIISAIEKHEKGLVLRFVVCQKERKNVAGLITVSEIDTINQSCSLSYMISPTFRGQGIAVTANRLVCDYMYSQFGMQRIAFKILETNKASQRVAEKLGAKNEGVQRSAVFKDGHFVNLICYSILKDEFYELPQ